jgi:hypothetical protein
MAAVGLTSALARRSTSQRPRPWMTGRSIRGPTACATRWKRRCRYGRGLIRRVRFQPCALFSELHGSPRRAIQKARPTHSERRRWPTALARFASKSFRNRTSAHGGQGGRGREILLSVHSHMLQPACGFKLANDGHDRINRRCRPLGQDFNLSNVKLGGQKV